MTSTDTIWDELEWTENRYEKKRKQLERGEIADSAIPSAYGRLGNKARSIAICRLLLDEDNVRGWLRRSADHYLEKIDKVEEYMPLLDKSYQIHRPSHCNDALKAAILADDEEYIRKAVEKWFATDRAWIADEDPVQLHVLYAGLALASFVDGDQDAASEWLEKLHALDRTLPLMTEGNATALAGLLDSDEETLTEGVSQILQAHVEEYGADPDAPVGFLSVEAAAIVALAEQEGLEIDRDDIDDDLLQSLPESLPD